MQDSQVQPALTVPHCRRQPLESAPTDLSFETLAKLLNFQACFLFLKKVLNRMRERVNTATAVGGNDYI